MEGTQKKRKGGSGGVGGGDAEEGEEEVVVEERGAIYGGGGAVGLERRRLLSVWLGTPSPGGLAKFILAYSSGSPATAQHRYFFLKV